MTTAKRNEMALAHEGIVRQQARRLRAHSPSRYDEGDLAGWGWVALLRALDKYDGRRGELGPYLNRKIEYGIYDALREAEHSRRQARPEFVSIEAAAPLADARGPDAVRGVLLREVWEAVERLPERWRQVLYLYYRRHRKMRQIGVELGVGESRVSQIHAAAMRKLRGMLAA